MKKIISDDMLLQGIKAFFVNAFVNHYAVERVAFGFEKPGDRAPIDLYLEHLRFGFNFEPCMRKNIFGVYIDEQERISIDQGYTEYVRDLFVYQMEKIFFNVKSIHLECEGEEIPLLPYYREYVYGLLPLFSEVLKIEVEYSVFDIIPTDASVLALEYQKWNEFVIAILLRKIKSNSRINKYVKHFTNAPYYIRRLIEKKGDSFYLKSADINSYEYAFALFSLMLFLNGENFKIFELKMLEWERRHNIM